MQIRKSELAKRGIDLPLGRYSSKVVGDKLEIYKHGGDSEGCILVGTGRLRDGVSNSRYAMRILQDAIEAAIKRGENVTIEVRNA